MPLIMLVVYVKTNAVVVGVLVMRQMMTWYEEEVLRLNRRAIAFVTDRGGRKYECRCGWCTGGETDDELLHGICYDAGTFDDIACRVFHYEQDVSSLKGYFRIIASFPCQTCELVFASILGDHGELVTYDDALSCMKYLMQDLQSDVHQYMITYRKEIDGDVFDDYGMTLYSNDGLGWGEVF